jgi:hypothetical protein
MAVCTRGPIGSVMQRDLLPCVSLCEWFFLKWWFTVFLLTYFFKYLFILVSMLGEINTVKFFSSITWNYCILRVMVECSSLQVRISNKTLTCFGSALRQKYSSDMIKKWTRAYCDLKMLVQIIHLKHSCETLSISLFIKPLCLWQVPSVTVIPHWLMVLQYACNFHCY